LKHKITIDFSKPDLGIKEAMYEFEYYKMWLKEKEDELVRRLAELGGRYAEAEFAHYPYETDGNNRTFAVYAMPDLHGWKITAYGEDIAFIEFGAGDYAKNKRYNSSNGQYAVNIEPGSWSIDDQKEYFKYGSWHYKNVKYHGIMPGNCMYNTSVELRRRVSEIAREVFAND